MNIQMIGIDHSMAQIDVREKFAFTKASQQEALQEIVKMKGINGCVILSTCNRMELYISTEEQIKVDLYQLICNLKNVDESEYRDYFVSREGVDVATHLFYLTAGMESRIIGEDQILMQVKDALSFSRINDTADKVLEVLFRMAVTAGKKVKTEITFSHENSSAVHGAIAQLKTMGKEFQDKICMVIGNGEMGRMTATAMREQGAKVTITVRQYRSGMVQIPDGCERINYGERYDFMPSCDYIVSATSSPNLTVTKEEVEKLTFDGTKVFLDLAVPRDIDVAIAELVHVERYDIDSFAMDPQSEELKIQMKEAAAILESSLQEFISWYQCKDFVPMIQNIGKAAAMDASWRMGRVYNQMGLSEQDRKTVNDGVAQVAEKVFQKVLFKLRDNVSADMLRECLDAMYEAYPEEIKMIEQQRKEQG